MFKGSEEQESSTSVLVLLYSWGISVPSRWVMCDAIYLLYCPHCGRSIEIAEGAATPADVYELFGKRNIGNHADTSGDRAVHGAMTRDQCPSTGLGRKEYQIEDRRRRRFR
jgi:hypothetical protein